METLAICACRLQPGFFDSLACRLTLLKSSGGEQVELNRKTAFGLILTCRKPEQTLARIRALSRPFEHEDEP